MATTRTVRCPRCSGTGTVCGGFCFLCWGATVHSYVVYTAQEKADRRLYATRRQAAYYAVKEGAKRLDEAKGLSILDDRYQEWSVWGFGTLESLEPDRLAKLFDSIDNGRLYDVIIALAAYGKAHANSGSEA